MANRADNVPNNPPIGCAAVLIYGAAQEIRPNNRLSATVFLPPRLQRPIGRIERISKTCLPVTAGIATLITGMCLLTVGSQEATGLTPVWMTGVVMTALGILILSIKVFAHKE